MTTFGRACTAAFYVLVISSFVLAMATWLNGCGYTENEMQMQRDRTARLEGALEQCMDEKADGGTDGR